MFYETLGGKTSGVSFWLMKLICVLSDSALIRPALNLSPAYGQIISSKLISLGLPSHSAPSNGRGFAITGKGRQIVSIQLKRAAKRNTKEGRRRDIGRP